MIQFADEQVDAAGIDTVLSRRELERFRRRVLTAPAIQPVSAKHAVGVSAIRFQELRDG